MPAITDKVLKVAIAGSKTTLASPGKALAATSVDLTDATGWPTDTAIIFALRRVDPTKPDANGNPSFVANTYTEWIGVLSGTTISGLTGTPLFGADQSYAADGNTEAYIPVSSSLWNLFVEAFLNQHNEDGSHGALTTSSLGVSGASTLAAITGTTLGLTGLASLVSAVFTGLVTTNVGTTANGSSGSITPPANCNMYTVTALAAAGTINAPAGTPVDGQTLLLRIKDNGSGQTLSWNAIYRAIGVTLPGSTAAGKVMYVGAKYNGQDSTWDVLSIARQS